jgi:hypothetical protein
VWPENFRQPLSRFTEKFTEMEKNLLSSLEFVATQYIMMQRNINKVCCFCATVAGAS